LTVTQLRPEITNPFVPPVTLTVALGAAFSVIGAVAVPDFEIVTFSEYVPPATCTVWPGATLVTAAPIVQNGAPCAPVPEFEQLGLEPST
jgi:hypothetical protein